MKSRGSILFKDLLSQLAQKSLFNGIRLEQMKDKNDPDWEDFILAIKKGEPQLFRKMKGAEKLASKSGHYFAQFEIWGDIIKINIAEDTKRNKYLRLAEGEGFNAVVQMLWYRSTAGQLRTLESWTTRDVNRVVLTSATTGNINNDIFVIKAPEYILAHNQTGLFTHDYGVLPVKEFLNKDDIDFYDHEERLADWFLASSLFEQLNHYMFEYVDDEMDLDTTKLIGNLTYQDAHRNDLPSARVIARMLNEGSAFDEDWYKAKYNTFTAGEQMLRKLIVPTKGSDTKIEKMQSTFDLSKNVEGFMKLLHNAFEMCGYSWNKNDGDENYANTASVINVNKTIYETTKMKKMQREEDWYDFFRTCAVAYFKKVKGYDENSAFAKADEIKENVVFEIKSDLLNDFLKSDERIRENFNAGLVSRKKAIQSLNPDMSEEDVDAEVSAIEGEEEKQKEFLKENVLNGDLSDDKEQGIDKPIKDKESEK